MNVPVRPAQEHPRLSDANVLLDALISYGITGDPRGAAATLIRDANDSSTPVLSLDVPSGLDATSSRVHTPAIQAAATMTLALPKTVLLGENAADAFGAFYLADISVPPALYAASSLNLEVGPFFALSDVVRL